jgi:hypothetical protein
MEHSVALLTIFIENMPFQKKNQHYFSRGSRQKAKGVFGLTFGFGFCLHKSPKSTKGLDPRSSFF